MPSAINFNFGPGKDDDREGRRITPGIAEGFPNPEYCVPAVHSPKPVFGKRKPLHICHPRVCVVDARGPGLGILLLEFVRRAVRDQGGVAAVETAIIIAALAPPFIWAGENLGPPLLVWATSLHQDVIAAQALVQQLGGAQ